MNRSKVALINYCDITVNMILLDVFLFEKNAQCMKKKIFDILD